MSAQSSQNRLRLVPTGTSAPSAPHEIEIQTTMVDIGQASESTVWKSHST